MMTFDKFWILIWDWIQANGVELRGCKIKWCDSKRGFGIFFEKDVSDGNINMNWVERRS